MYYEHIDMTPFRPFIWFFSMARMLHPESAPCSVEGSIWRSDWHVVGYTGLRELCLLYATVPGLSTHKRAVTLCPYDPIRESVHLCDVSSDACCRRAWVTSTRKNLWFDHLPKFIFRLFFVSLFAISTYSANLLANSMKRRGETIPPYCTPLYNGNSL